MNRKNKLSGSGGQDIPHPTLGSKQSGNRIKWQHSYYVTLAMYSGLRMWIEIKSNERVETLKTVSVMPVPPYDESHQSPWYIFYERPLSESFV